MATRLAAQRSFINVVPTTVGTPNSSAGSIAGEDSGAVQASASDVIEGTASGNSAGASELVSAVATINATEPTSPVMTTRTSTASQLPAITIAGNLKNGSTKPASTVASATVLSNNNIFNLLSGTGLSLQQIVQKKIMIHPNGNVINIVPLNDESDGTDVKVEKQMEASDSTESGSASEATADDTPQVTAQVAVVQGQSPTDATPQYITVTVSSADNVPNHHTYVQYVDSDMYTTANQGQTQMSYPVYTVGDYGTNGQQQQQQQQYYATTGNYSNTGTGSSSGAHSDTTAGTTGGSANSGTGSANTPNGVNGSVSTGSGAPSSGTANQQPQQQQQYIVPVGESVLLGTGVNGSNGSNGSAQQSDSSPQNMTDEASYLHAQHASAALGQGDVYHTPNNLAHAVRVLPATMNWLVENYETADGVSLPRSTLYNHYMWHCNENKLDAVNAASFGKLIRNVFSGLRTRRLGTRGNSKYHYYGIRIKPTSPLVNAMDCKPQLSGQLIGGHQQQLGNGHGCGGGSNHGGNMNTGNNGMNVHGGGVVGGNGAGNGLQSNGSMTGVGGTGGGHGGGGSGGGLAHHQGAAGGHGMSMGHGGRGHKKNSFKAEMPESCAQYLGDPSSAIPQFPIIDMIHPLADDITLEDVDTLRSIYREHCEAFLDAILNLDFNMIESLWREFWRAENNNNNGDECEEEKYLSKQKLYLLTQCEPVQEFVKDVDFKFYQNMVDVLIPDVLRPIPTGLTQAIRNFAKNLESWLTSAMSGCPEPIMAIKLSAVSAFGQTLRRYTSLNHLAQAARAVLQNGQQIAQMLSDLNRVDFRNVQEQASWICQCDTAIVQRLENDFKAALQQQNTLEEWAGWLQNVVDDALQDYRGKPSFVNAARQFLLKWSFYSSMVIRDLTLRSAGSFGSFHLIRLLYDEYMFFIIEHKVAKATNTTPIAVMGQQKVSPVRPVHDELDSMLYNSEYGIVNVKLEPSAKRMRS
ncbi:DNA-binding protein RFX2 isoform X1 [Anopheles aquasalis]|uniref:DNA-binding protein RFX2 isoform X1 n=1 Tax=Anopheles aquasalis TaxID=42839 RepID=UPI00215B17D7|nr:DNA-binding protein RFX2 isoform X1 [Anopheles aquasalis]XP_050082640.1 DNA-binding protein RFX2 isoform X1 [Anopheles aquasalis]